jgi:phosphoglycerol transferase MdoB-like AlkP superfamily enzyme
MQPVQRLRDLAVYVVIAVLIAIGGVVYGVYTADHGLRPDLPKGLWGAVTAAFLSGSAAKAFWRYRRRVLLWIALVALAALHIATYQYLTRNVQRTPFVPVAIVLFPEYAAIVFCLERLLGPRSGARV